jgi:serine/threonine-protein kinase HipA
VHLDAADLGPAVIVGRLRRSRQRGLSVISFEYEADWLTSARAFSLDPSLGLFPGQQYPQNLPGIFADTTPDRWGRTLLERDVARTEGRARVLDAWDLLTLVRDELRMGALRFARATDGVFVASDPPAVPPLARLRELEHQVREVESGRIATAAVADLVAPGSPLGGNRPKANYLDDGALWMAKFPSATDRWNFAQWEYLLNQLAADAGIAVPRSRLLGPYLAAHHTFAAQRFDRQGAQRRLFASAMTLTGHQDHGDASYLDIVRTIVLHADPARIEEELAQLFRRVVFNVLSGHRDDHLRNHGFLRGDRGWRLSPAYDLNPRPDARSHELALDDTSKAPDVGVVLATAPYYRLTEREARLIVAEVSAALAGWPDRAARLGIAQAEIELMRSAFGV